MVERYVGVKYRICEGGLTKKPIFTAENKHLIRAMKKVAKDIAERGMSPGTSGNMSVRVRGGFIITATATKLKNLSDEDFVLVEGFDFDSNTLTKAYGMKKPSSETPMHYTLYKNHPEIKAIIHVHDSFLMDERAAKRCKVPITKEVLSYGTLELARAVDGLIGERKAAIIRSHGIVVAGKDTEECAKRLLRYHRMAKSSRR